MISLDQIPSVVHPDAYPIFRAGSAWLLKRIGIDAYGKKANGHPIHEITTEEIFRRYDQLKKGINPKRHHLTTAHFATHFTNNETYYYTASGRASTSEVLVNIDVDCHHGVGSRAGAQSFSEYLRATYLRDLYTEASTNDYGAHSYLVLAKGSMGAQRLNVVLKRFDGFLKGIAALGNWDISGVEVMGRPPEFTWGAGRYDLLHVKAGVLAKLPREVLTRGSELMATTRMTVAQLERMIRSSPSTPVKQAESGSETPKISVSVPAEISTVDSVQVAEQPPVQPETIPITTTVPTKKKAKPGAQPASAPHQPGSRSTRSSHKSLAGSISPLPISEANAKQIKTKYMRIARNEFEPCLAGDKRHRATFEDYAVFLCILCQFHLHPNENGAMPTARFEVAWKALYEAKFTTRAWNPSRFKAIRDWTDRRDWINWTDTTYLIGRDYGYGYVKGEAAKWSAGMFLAGVFADEIQDKSSGTDPQPYKETTLCTPCHKQIGKPSEDILPFPVRGPICAGFIGQKSRLKA